VAAGHGKGRQGQSTEWARASNNANQFHALRAAGLRAEAAQTSWADSAAARGHGACVQQNTLGPAPLPPGTSPSHARPGSRPAGAARWAGRGAGARRMRCTASRRAAGAVPGHTPGSAISGAAACRIVAAARLAAAPAGRCSLQRSLPHHHSSSQRARRAWFVAQGVRGAEPVKLSEFLGRDAVGHARRALAGARRAPRELRRRERRTRGRKRGAPRGARSWAPRPALVSTADPFTPPSRTGRAAGVCGARRRVAGRRGRGSGRRQRTDGPVGARGRTRRDRVGKFAAPAGRAGGAGPRRRQRHSR